MPLAMMLRHVLVAVTLLVAGLVVAPADANAHAGHSHSTSEASIANAPSGDVVVKSEIQTPAAILTSVASDPIDYGRLKPCQAGCCTALSAGCCAAWIAPVADLQHPNSTIIVFSAHAEQRTGITPDVLPKPPKAQA